MVLLTTSAGSFLGISVTYFIPTATVLTGLGIRCVDEERKHIIDRHVVFTDSTIRLLFTKRQISLHVFVKFAKRHLVAVGRTAQYVELQPIRC